MKDFKHYVVLDSVVATWIWKPISIEDFKHCIITIGTSWSANCTIKFKADAQEATQTFWSAASISNLWDTVQVIDLENGTPIDWDTWIVYSWTDAVRNFEININWLSHFTLDVTARSAWTIKATAYLTNNS